VKRHTSANRAAVILGAADGLTLAISEFMSLRHQQSAIFHSVLGAGLGELVGMAAALWLSSGRDLKHFISALACGLATALGCILPGLPYLLTRGAAALVPALGIVAVLGAVVCWLREERGWLAIAETYGVLTVAGLLCFGASFT
jgi:VIT1/CCC1 family predicted Fe2+/Mn2+ transporter